MTPARRPVCPRHAHPAAAFLLAITVAAWWPATVAASVPEATVASALKDKRPLGQGRLRVWGFEVYDASLWASPGFDGQRFQEQRFALELHYLRALKGRDIAARSIDEMKALARISPEQATRWQQALDGLFPDVERGDRITGVHVPGSGARFYVNGRLRGEVADPDFARLFFGIWLSPRTSQPALRASLLQAPAQTP
jgi:hypothetical protein